MMRFLLSIIISCFALVLTGQNFSTVAAMKDAAWLGNGQVVTTSNFNEGDGAFSTYQITTGLTANEITIIAITGTSLQAVRVGQVSSLSDVGVVYGSDVSISDKQLNWTKLKTLYESTNRLVVTDTLDVWVTAGDSLAITKGITIEGDPGACIRVHPKRKNLRGRRIVFDLIKGETNINIPIEGYDSRWSYETVDVTFRPAGDADAVEVTGTPSADFWTNVVVGDTVLIQFQDSQEGESRIVSVVDEGSSKISFTAGFGTADDFTVAGESYLGLVWSETADPDTISTYGKQWNTICESSNDACRISEELILFNHRSIDDSISLNISNSHIRGFDRIVFAESGFLQINSYNTLYQANSIAFSWTGADTTRYQYISMDKGQVYDCATLVEASINSNGIVSTNARFGGGGYLHPGIITEANEILFRNNNSTAWRQFSSSSNDISAEAWSSSFSNCRWEANNKEPLLILSKSMPTMMTNCRLFGPVDGGVSPMYIGNSLTAIGCTFDLPMVCNLNSEPDPSDPNRYYIDISESTIGKNGRISLNEWPDSTDRKTYTTFRNTRFHIGQSGGYTIRYQNGYLSLFDCKVENNYFSNSTPLNDFIVIDTSGVNDTLVGTIEIDDIVYIDDLSSNSHNFISSATSFDVTDSYEVIICNPKIKATNITSNISGSVDCLDKSYAEGWELIEGDDYTVGSPLQVSSSTDTLTVANNGNTSRISGFLPFNVSELWSVTDSAIVAVNPGDGYVFRFSFTAENSAQNGYASFGLDIGGDQGILKDTKRTITFPRGANIAHPFSYTTSLFTLNDFVNNGGKIKLIGGSGTTSIYDVSIFIKRIPARD